VTQQIINVGSAIADGTGDPARVAFTHCNENFTELYTLVRPTGQTIEYQFSNTTTEPPSSGQIQFNQATQASTTKIWASHTTSSGINIKQFLAAATTGAKLVLQDKIDNTNYIKFDVTGAPVDKTTYWEFAVAVTASGGNLPNAAILAAVTAAAGGGTGTSDPTPPQGRLTLQTATPVMTATQSAKTTIYYTPYIGNKVPIYDGANMMMTTFGELSVATTDTTKSPAAIGVSKVNDWFVWSDAGTVRIGHGPDWTSDTARSAGTALVRVSGILLNSVAITNGPAASRGTYVGTTRSNGSSQLDWIFGGPSVGGTAAFFGVWNCYNRTSVFSMIRDTTASWTYTTITYRQADGSSTIKASYVIGIGEDVFEAEYFSAASASAGVTYNPSAAIGYDDTTNPSGIFHFANQSGSTINLTAKFGIVSALGFHFVTALEQGGGGAGTTTWYGYTAASSAQTGLYFRGMM
jgi:hypothetical protein